MQCLLRDDSLSLLLPNQLYLHSYYRYISFVFERLEGKLFRTPETYVYKDISPDSWVDCVLFNDAASTPMSV
jgi:hypothetical protein